MKLRALCIRAMGCSSDPKILIVEDERDLADLYSTWLSDDYAVTTTYRGPQALEVLDETFEVVLLDRRMPDMSGGEVLEEIREQDYDCRVAMVTAVEPDLDIIEMSFDDYLVKPISESELRTMVTQLLKLVTYDDQLQEYYAAASKKATLDATMDEEQLVESVDYTDLTERIDGLKEQLDETLADLAADDEGVSNLLGFGLLRDSGSNERTTMDKALE